MTKRFPNFNSSYCFCILLFLCKWPSGSAVTPWHQQKHSHTSRELTFEELQRLALLSSKISFDSLLDPFLVSRASGTAGNVEVRKHIKNQMSDLGWSIESDEFTDHTPLGVKSFENVISTLNPNAPRRLVLACHYDSKYSSREVLVGATDSAVPCAMLIHLAHSLRGPLETYNSTSNNLSLQFIFFDGEEAFQTWSSHDSLYGSRHLADKWANMPYSFGNSEGTTQLDRMDMLILLDLIGEAKPTFLNFFEPTSAWHNQLVNIELRLRQNVKNGLWNEGKSRGIFDWFIPPTKEFFKPKFSFSRIDDDHVPFHQRGVNILHIISSPFPKVWHTARDNKANLNFVTIDNLNKIFRVFVSRYLHLPLDSKEAAIFNGAPLLPPKSSI